MKKLDNIDLQVLTILYNDADITNKELAAKIGIDHYWRGWFSLIGRFVVIG